MKVLSVLSVMMIPVTIGMCGKRKIVEKNMEISDKIKPNIKNLFKDAFKNRNYRFIVIGFFTCGFHMAIITNHLATQIMSYGHSYAAASYAFSIYGIATILGCLFSGALCSRLPMERGPWNVIWFKDNYDGCFSCFAEDHANHMHIHISPWIYRFCYGNACIGHMRKPFWHAGSNHIFQFCVFCASDRRIFVRMDWGHML